LVRAFETEYVKLQIGRRSPRSERALAERLLSDHASFHGTVSAE
jgi:hypothetical protein